ncbi:phytoene desaturase family protein [Paludisphaera borealis]|uniref:Ferredoxin--NADP reductase n=1 Tax=Paludisphaera borealis TaxID=1387353 RepID=A0A1U7CPT3_9BACT|nr:FAD-dependent oxidoreductase [Paludisphaera borealis]APW60942.1 Ferredoxin--NADP reductase [Paludisphaera borealis]
MLDVVVIGAGMGGLAAASLAQRAGLRTVLLESHSRLGGSAGYFQRGPYTFDAGATALMGLDAGEPLRAMLDLLGVEFESVPTASYRVHLPDRTLDIVADAAVFERNTTRAFGEGNSSAARQRAFWRLQAAVGGALFRASSQVPRLPVRALGDLAHDACILGFRGVLAASTSILTVLDVLRLLGLSNDVPFRTLIAMLLQDTAQAGPETVPFANAAACLQAYRLGMRRPVGGMRSLVEGIGQRFAAFGGDLRVSTIVDRVDALEHGFEVTTRRRERLRARQVIFNVPLDLASRLLRRSLQGRLGGRERRSRAAWSAFTGYVAIKRAAISDAGPLFHQVLQAYGRPIQDGNNVLISLSSPSDTGYGPSEVRVATMSTHTRPSDWQGLDRVAYEAKKAEYEGRLLAALSMALPDAPASLQHAEFASPRSFQRYTRRTAGAVGGPPVSRANSNFMAVGSDVFGPGLWVVGDSVFPGQGTMAVVLSAVRVVERITGRSWGSLRASPMPGQEACFGLPDLLPHP